MKFQFRIPLPMILIVGMVEKTFVFVVLRRGFFVLIELLASFFSYWIDLISGIIGVIVNFFRFNSNQHAPRTAIGKDYEWRISSSDKRLRRRSEAIKKSDEFEDNKEVGSAAAVPYGPFYRTWEDKHEMWKILKQKSWNHVLLETSLEKEEDKKTIQDHYYEEIKKIEDESRQLYSRDESIDLLSSHDFIMMMILDGCFLLQVALSVLGGSQRLNHLRDFQLLIPNNNWKQQDDDDDDDYNDDDDNEKTTTTTQSKKKKKKKEKNDKSQPFRVTTMIRVAVSSMFIVGNQIPLVVLKVLMKQRFFTKFISQGIWEEPVDLERWILYELLLVPMFHGANKQGEIIPTKLLLDHLIAKERRRKFWSIFGAMVRKKDASINATDLLHGFWLLMTGLTDSVEDEVENNNNDVVIINDNGRRHRSHSSFDFLVPKVRSANELKLAGIDFRYKQGTKINGIKFRNYPLNTSLVLPRITMVSQKELYELLRNLIQYEDIRFGGSRKQVCEYLQLMCGLIRSADDAKVLNADGIIVAHPDDLEKNVVRFFQKLESVPQLMRNNGSLIRSVRDELNDYIQPSTFKKLGVVLNVVAVLTVIQTVFTVISYVWPRNS